MRDNKRPRLTSEKIVSADRLKYRVLQYATVLASRCSAHDERQFMVILKTIIEDLGSKEAT